MAKITAKTTPTTTATRMDTTSFTAPTGLLECYPKNPQSPFGQGNRLAREFTPDEFWNACGWYYSTFNDNLERLIPIKWLVGMIRRRSNVVQVLAGHICDDPAGRMMSLKILSPEIEGDYFRFVLNCSALMVEGELIRQVRGSKENLPWVKGLKSNKIQFSRAQFASTFGADSVDRFIEYAAEWKLGLEGDPTQGIPPNPKYGFEGPSARKYRVFTLTNPEIPLNTPLIQLSYVLRLNPTAEVTGKNKITLGVNPTFAPSVLGINLNRGIEDATVTELVAIDDDFGFGEDTKI